MSNSDSGASKGNIVSEFVLLFKNAFSGIFGILDFVLGLFMGTFAIFGTGVKKTASATKNTGQYTMSHGGNTMFREIFALVIAVVDGVIGIFYFIGEIPTMFSKEPKKPANEPKTKEEILAARAAERKAEEEKKKKAKTDLLADGQRKDIFLQISDYIKSKYEEIPYVKKQKEEREAKLVPITLDKNNPDDTYRYPAKQTFKYTARNSDGVVVSGYFPAFSRMDVFSYLQDMNMTVYEIYTNKTIQFLHAEAGGGLKQKMSNKDLVFWLTQLSTYIKAGIPLMDAVKVLAKQDKRKKYQSLYDALIYELTMGTTFSDALERQGNSFPQLLINLVKASELSGTIEETLDQMGEYYTEIEENRKDVISAIAYPLVVLVFAVGIMSFMLVYIVPKFADVYKSMGSEINPITQFCLDLSSFLGSSWYIIISIIVGVVVAFITLFRKVKGFKIIVQSILLRLPVISRVLIAKEINMFSRTFASLQHNNVLIADSIDVLAKITENELYKRLMIDTIDNLVKGNKMSDTFKNNWIIPDIAYFMIVTGESTGELAEMLDKVADYYRKEQKNAVGAIKTFIEPALIVFLAVAVGFILIAVLVPMFDMYSTLM